MLAYRFLLTPESLLLCPAEAMRELGDEMSGTSVATILDAMDVHGFISLDQFVAIVEAEAIDSHSANARLLRRLSKDPIWWTRTT